LLYDSGARIVTCGRRQEKLSALLQDVPEKNRPETNRLTVVAADISDAVGLDAIFGAVRSGLGQLDYLVANAAIAGEGVYDTSEDAIDEILRVNLFGQIACVKRSLDLMRPGGRIVLVGSMSADVREEEGNVYVASKAGLQGFADAFRKQANKRGIHVHLIEPGSVATPLHGLSEQELAEKRARSEMLVAGEVAECIAFILTRSPVCDIVSLQVRPHRQFI
jgi:NAD(P)-dependent dehydrogenase (short-subunit alcohol dehydrogenase family)